MLREVLDIQLRRIAQLQAEVDILQCREGVDAPTPLPMPAQPSPANEPSQGSISPLRFIDRQELLVSAARGRIWQP